MFCPDVTANIFFVKVYCCNGFDSVSPAVGHHCRLALLRWKISPVTSVYLRAETVRVGVWVFPLETGMKVVIAVGHYRGRSRLNRPALSLSTLVTFLGGFVSLLYECFAS